MNERSERATKYVVSESSDELLIRTQTKEAL